MITAVGTFIAGQKHGKAEFITAVSKASDIVITKLEGLVDRTEAAHAKCETELAAVKVQIEALMQGRVALPGERAPRDE